MYSININIADRYPKPGEPLVVTTTTAKPFLTEVQLFETDTYYDASKQKRKEGKGGRTLLAHFKVKGKGEKFTEVTLLKMAQKPPPRGFFEDTWDEFRFFHEKGSDEVFAHRCKSKTCHMQVAKHAHTDPKRLACASRDDLKGKIIEVERDGQKRKAIELVGTKVAGLRAYLELVDDNTLSGFRYSLAGVAEKDHADTRARAAKDPRRFLYMVRGRPYTEEPPGLEIPLIFQGVDKRFALWISEDELTREFVSSEHDYARHTQKAFLLEIGLLYKRKTYRKPGRFIPSKSKLVQTYLRHYAEYPIPYEPQDKQALLHYVVANRGWLAGARLGPADKRKLGEKELLALGAMLIPGKPKWWEEPAFKDIYLKARKKGWKDRLLVRESLFTRFALGGFVPGKVPEKGNPFRDRDRMLAFEFDIYCKPAFASFKERDMLVEICQHAPDHKHFPGRRWHVADGHHFGHGDEPRIGDAFDGLAEGIIVPKGCRVRRQFYGQRTYKWLPPGKHRLRAKDEPRVMHLKVVWDDWLAVYKPGDYRHAAYRRGRQLGRIAEEAALSATDEPDKSLIDKSVMVGLEVEDIRAFFKQAFEAARFERECLMVKTFCQLGLDQKSKNPFDEKKSNAHHKEIERFKKIVKKKAYAGAVREGRALWEVRNEGHKQGLLDYRNMLHKAPKLTFPNKTKYDPSDSGKFWEELGIFFDISTPIEKIDWPTTRAKRWSEALAAQKPLKCVMTKEPPEEFLQRQTLAGNVKPEVADKIYREGWRNGCEQAFNAHVFGFFERQGVQELMREALKEYVSWLVYKKKKSGYIFEIDDWIKFDNFPERDQLTAVRDPDAYTYQKQPGETDDDPRWAHYGTPYNHIHNHQETTAFLKLRMVAAKHHIPPHILNVMIRASLHKQGPEIVEDLTSWAPLLHTIFVSPFEIGKLLVLSSWDAVVNYNGYWFDRSFDGEASKNIDKCKKWSKNCIFHGIPSEGSWWALWAFSTFAVADAVFTVGMAVSGVGLLALAGRNIGKLGFKAFVGTMVRGGITLMTGNGYRMLRMGLAVGSVTGVTEELVEAYLQKRDVSVLGMVGRTLRNTAMYCAFSAVGGVLGKGKLKRVFGHAAVLPLSSGMVAGVMRMVDAAKRKDAKQAEKVFLEMLVLTSDMLVLSGIPGIGRALIRGYLARKGKKLAPHHGDPKLESAAEIVKTEAPQYKPKTKQRVKNKHNKPVTKLRPDVPKFKELDIVPMTKQLSAADIKAIERHPVFKKLRKRYKKGKGLIILLSQLSDSGIKHENWGEQVQSRFLERVVRHILPEAEIKPGMIQRQSGSEPLISQKQIQATLQKEASAKGKHLVVMHAWDSAEAAWDAGVKKKPTEPAHVMDNPSVEHLEMGPLKTVNNLADVPKGHRAKVRETLNIGSDDRVVSVYQAARYAYQGEAISMNKPPTVAATYDVVKVAKAIRDGRKLRIIVSAAYGKTLSPIAKAHYKKQLAGVKFFNVTEITPSTDLGKVAVIFNNTHGRMTHVHAFADMVVVQGPVNPYEGLRARVPTIHLLEKGEPYDRSVLDYYKAAGERSGAFKQFRHVRQSELKKAAQELLGKTPKPFSHSVIDAPGTRYHKRTPYQVFLDNLTHYTEPWPRTAYAKRSVLAIVKDRVKRILAYEGGQWLVEPLRFGAAAKLYYLKQQRWRHVGNIQFDDEGQQTKMILKLFEGEGPAEGIEHALAELLSEDP